MGAGVRLGTGSGINGDHTGNPGPMTLAELLNAKLCHDLAGPIGAAATGAELLTDLADPDIASPEIVAMVAQSAQGASDRLRFLRLAFGPAAASPLGAENLRLMALNYLASYGSANGTYQLRWNIAGPDLPGLTAKCAVNLLIIAKDALPLGGQIELSLDPHPILSASGPKVVVSPEVLSGLRAVFDTTPKGAHAFMTGSLAQKLGGNLVTHATPVSLELAVKSD